MVLARLYHLSFSVCGNGMHVIRKMATVIVRLGRHHREGGRERERERERVRPGPRQSLHYLPL